MKTSLFFYFLQRVLQATSVYLIICKKFQINSCLKRCWNFTFELGLTQNIFFVVLKVPFSGVFSPRDDFYQFAPGHRNAWHLLETIINYLYVRCPHGNTFTYLRVLCMC